MKQLQLEQEEKKKKELYMISLKRKEKEDKNLSTKQKIAELIINRRQKLLEKFSNSAEKIKKQKEDNSKQLANKYLLAAMKREDTLDNLERFEKMREIKRNNRAREIQERIEKIKSIHNEKERIKSTKKQMGVNLTLRKRQLKDIVSDIINNGKYKSKEDIYKKVFNDDELYTLGKNNNGNVTENNIIDKKNDTTMNNTKNGETFFVTQPNNITTENIYTVKSGDSLYRIAINFNTTVDELKRINNLSSNNLSIGQKLIIPSNSSEIIYTVIKGDSLYAISKKFNTSVDEIKRLNNLSNNNLSIGQKLIIKK